jgi:hypothetical protein
LIEQGCDDAAPTKASSRASTGDARNVQLIVGNLRRLTVARRDG